MRYIINFIACCLSAIAAPIIILMAAAFLVVAIGAFALLIAVVLFFIALHCALSGKNFKKELEEAWDEDIKGKK